MRTKFILLSLLLVLGLSLNTYAVEKTIAEKKWDSFLETADLQYDAHDGELISSFETYTPLPLDNQDLWDNLTWSNKMIYALNDNLEIYGNYFTSTQLAVVDSVKYFTKQYYGALKDKFITRGPLTVAIKGDANYFRYNNDGDDYIYTTFTVNGTVYSNLRLSNAVTLYNNLNLASKKDNEDTHWFSKSIINGVELNPDDHTTLRVASWTSLNDLGSMQPYFSAILRSKHNDNVTYILHAENQNSGILSPYIIFSNVVEFKNTPTEPNEPATVLTAQLTTALAADTGTAYSIDGSQQFGLMTLKAGYSRNITSDTKDVATLSGCLQLNFTANCHLGLEVQKITETNAQVSSDNLKLISKLSIEL